MAKIKIQNPRLGKGFEGMFRLGAKCTGFLQEDPPSRVNAGL
jgi:hypothetical protein